MRTFLILMLLLSPVLAQAQVELNVNQTHTLTWHWAQGDQGPVTEFLFACGTYRKRLPDPDLRRLTFSSLVDSPGTYTGCTLTAVNEAGRSAPVLVPDFTYAYSYTALLTFLLELAATLGAAAGVVVVYGTKLAAFMLRRQSKPLALPEPLIVLEPEATHVHHYS